MCFAFKNLHLSSAQLQQDLFVLYYFTKKNKYIYDIGENPKGFFVEFGATDGKTLSNTYMFEKIFGWEGVVCEPGRIWRKRLGENRNCKIDYRCVFSKSGLNIEFKETREANLSTISEYLDKDLHSLRRNKHINYTVETVTLEDLLIENSAPRDINYISIDTEGSEYEILRDFDFKKWNIEIFTIEHNFTMQREKIISLMNSNDYIQVLPEVSFFDGWFIKKESFENLWN
jgi:FkbM family methyltransferase